VFKILLAFVQMSKGFKVAFAEINFPPDIDILITSLQEHPKCQSIQFVVLRFDDPELRFLLEAIKQELANIEIQSDKKLVLILQGLEKAIAFSGDNPPILTNLNYARDSFPVAIPHPVLFALPDYAVTRIAQFAPDFWAWTSATFKFQTPPETRDRLTAEVSNFSHNPNRYFAKPERGERIDLLERLLQEYAEDTEASSRTRLELLNQLGKAHQSIREFDKAKLYFQQAIELCRKLNFQNGEFEALYNLGVLCYSAREFENAKCSFNQSLVVKEKIGDKQGQADVYHCLGMVAQKLGEYAEAQQNYQQALAIKIEFGDLYSQGSTYAQLGTLALELQKYTEAQQNYQQALTIFIEFDDYSSQANTYQSFGMVAQLLREYAESRQYYQKALANFIEFGDSYSQARVYVQLGLLAKAENNFTEAGKNLLQALEIFTQFQDQHSVEMIINILFYLYQATHEENLLEDISKVLGITIEEVRQKLELA
jgi:tetratricopeptide (TPR) repeat protein